MSRSSFQPTRLLCVLLALSAAGSAVQERWSKAWEEMLELSQPSEKIMDAVGIKPGMVVADVGAGNGRFAVRLARRVGGSGMVYANDIDPRALEFMNERVRRENIPNLVVVEGRTTDPRLPRGAVDAVILANTLHMVEEPVPLLKNLIPALKTGGILVLLEADREKLLSQNNDHMAGMVLSRAEYLKWIAEAGYELVAEHTFLPRHFMLVFRAES